MLGRGLCGHISRTPHLQREGRPLRLQYQVSICSNVDILSAFSTLYMDYIYNIWGLFDEQTADDFRRGLSCRRGEPTTS